MVKWYLGSKVYEKNSIFKAFVLSITLNGFLRGGKLWNMIKEKKQKKSETARNIDGISLKWDQHRLFGIDGLELYI